MSRRRKEPSRNPATTGTSPVPGVDGLRCPVPRQVIDRLIRHAHAHPWRGDRPLLCPHHLLDTTAITEPGRPLRLLFSLDFGYHQSGWFANADFERCLHISISHPRPDRARLYRAGAGNLTRDAIGIDLEAPAEAEIRAWGRVFYGEHHVIARYEPPVGPLDPYRSPGVSHLRLHLDSDGHPIMPAGEPYTLKIEPGLTPPKIADGRAGADVR